LSLVVEAIGMLEGMNEVSGEINDNIEKYYKSMSVLEQENCMNIIEEALGEDDKLFFYCMTYLMKTIKDVSVMKRVLYYISAKNIATNTKDSLLFQTVFELFVNSEKYEYKSVYSDIMGVYEGILGEVLNVIGPSANFDVVDIKDNKKIVIMLEPMLSEYHAPTRLMVNMYYYLQNLGYEPVVFAGSKKNLHISNSMFCYANRFNNSAMEETAKFKVKYFDVEVQGAHLNYTVPQYYNDILTGLNYIYNEKPLMVISIGGNNLLADLCNIFTKVAVMGTTNHMPITVSDNIIRYFKCTEEKIKEYEELKTNMQKIIQINWKGAKILEDRDENLSRATYGIGEDAFVICIAGNRLDFEIDNAMLKVIEEIIGKDEKITVMFVGDCALLKGKIVSSESAKQCVFTGFTDYFRQVLGMADIIINPPRQGGGGVGTVAVEKGIPVITLGNCDVSSVVGEEFVCGDISEMPYLVDRYRNDKEFYEKQRAMCLKRSKSNVDINKSEENIACMIKEIIGTV